MKKVRCGGRPVTLIVLAGGLSRRMRRDKALLPMPRGVLVEWVARSLAPHFDEVLLSVSPGKRDRPHPFRPVEDDVRGQGPLRGILTGLMAASHEACFIVACDMPDVRPALIRALVRRAASFDVTMVRSGDGLKEPLLGVYKKSVIPVIEGLLASGERSVQTLVDRARTGYVRVNRADLPVNLNTPDDYRDYLKARRIEAKRNA